MCASGSTVPLGSVACCRWQSAQTRTVLNGWVSESASLLGRIACVPWHVVQVGASGAPRARASACEPRSNVTRAASWQDRAQPTGSSVRACGSAPTSNYTLSTVQEQQQAREKTRQRQWQTSIFFGDDSTAGNKQRSNDMWSTTNQRNNVGMQEQYRSALTRHQERTLLDIMIHEHGMSVRDYAINENKISDIEEYILEWFNKNGSLF